MKKNAHRFGALLAVSLLLPFSLLVDAKEKKGDEKEVRMMRDCADVAEDKWMLFRCKKENLAAKRHNTEIFESYFKDYANAASDASMLSMIESIPESISFDQVDDEGNNYLGRLTRSDSVPLIEALKSVGVSPSRRNKLRETPLMIAVKRGLVSNAKHLITPENIDMRNQRGNTALHIASARGDVEMTELLLANAASMKVVNNRGLTPTDVAALKEDLMMLELLLAKGGEINGDAIVAGNRSLWRVISLNSDSPVMQLIERYRQIKAQRQQEAEKAAKAAEKSKKEK